jgi:N-acetylglucosaminyl-diphospho-decaprenol L-rhamnosyltransferase
VSDAGYNVAYSACTTVTHFEGAGRAWVGSRAVLNTSDSYLIFARKYFSGWEQFVLRLFLPVAFVARAAVCFAVSLLVHDMHQHDKAKAFATAAWRMFSGNMERA